MVLTKTYFLSNQLPEHPLPFPGFEIQETGKKNLPEKLKGGETEKVFFSPRLLAFFDFDWLRSMTENFSAEF